MCHIIHLPSENWAASRAVKSRIPMGVSSSPEHSLIYRERKGTGVEERDSRHWRMKSRRLTRLEVQAGGHERSGFKGVITQTFYTATGARNGRMSPLKRKQWPYGTAQGTTNSASLTAGTMPGGDAFSRTDKSRRPSPPPVTMPWLSTQLADPVLAKTASKARIEVVAALMLVAGVVRARPVDWAPARNET